MRSFQWRAALFDIAFNVLNDNDGVIDYDANR